jgi:hypothetical protein
MCHAHHVRHAKPWQLHLRCPTAVIQPPHLQLGRPVSGRLLGCLGCCQLLLHVSQASRLGLQQCNREAWP